MDKIDNRKKAVVEALTMCHGIVSDACRITDTPRSTFYKWLNEDTEFKKAVDETQEIAIDFVEGQLFKKINGIEVQQGENVYTQPPSDTAIIFYLKTKGKKRGYVERTEIAAEIKENNKPSWFDNLPVITTTNGQLKES